MAETKLYPVWLLWWLVLSTISPAMAWNVYKTKQSLPEIDSLVAVDTLATTDSLQADTSTLLISPDTLDAPVEYACRDSIVYDVMNKKIILYKEATVRYKDIELRADYIEFDWTTNILTATGITDSTGKMQGKPVFKDRENTYTAERISYNFKTKKGKVYKVMTREGEGYIHGEQIKKNEQDEWYGMNAWYTTCENEHPHFYIRARKVKMVPNKLMVTGPANLVVADVPTPLFIPFGIFPLKRGQRSGIILPAYGESAQLGFFLKGGGYYWAVNDYMDLAVRGDIYSRGSYNLNTLTRYKKRYKFGGNVNLNFARTRIGEPELPGFKIRNDFKVSWNHSQDSRARPNSNFSSRVNVGSSSYDRTYSQGTEQVLNNQFNSSMNYQLNIPNTRANLAINAQHSQNINTHKIDLLLPQLTFNVARVQPFARKVVAGKAKWYEKIGFTYSFNAQTRFSGIDSTFFRRQTFKNLQYGIRHQLPVNTSIKLFKYFTLTPSFNYTERWYFRTIQKHWDPDTIIIEQAGTTDTLYGRVITDTIRGFKAGRDFNISASLSTRLYGTVNLKRTKVKAVRHVLTPSLNFTYRPDFGDERWGYYRTVQKNAAGETERYSIFSNVNSVYGGPAAGKSGRLGLTLNNILEMKRESKKDTVTGVKKIKILEGLTISTGYDFARDSLRLSPLSINGRTTLFKGLSLLFGTTLDPYTTTANGKRIDRFVWEDKRRLTRMTNANVSLTGSFSSASFGTKKSDAGTEEELEMINEHPEAFVDFTIPWTFSMSYNLNLSRGHIANPDSILVTQSLSFSGDFNLTPKWKVSISSGFDFRNKTFTYTNLSVIRDLHCWELKFRWAPWPLELQFYSIDLNVKSSVLQDLKLSKKKERFDSLF